RNIEIDGINLIGIGFSRSLKEDLIYYRNWFTEDQSRIWTYLKESSNRFILEACGIKVDASSNITTMPIDDSLKNMKGLIDKFDFFLEDELTDLFKNVKSTNFSIIMTHSPPFGMLDKLPGLPNIGSISITNIIKSVMPKLVLCGHFHENVGVMTFQDSVKVFNPGALKDNYYGEIEIKHDEIKTNIVKV
ncbi:MAG TPA: hypothetical protein PK771_15940, partial [Spirochaetota bacterium]|nr:hypothetical protein [Spirochaetota bacterium]